MISLFHHKLAFEPVDPLGDGLGDEIAQEQREPEAIKLTEDIEPDFDKKWSEMVKDIHNDPEWISFSEDE